MGASRILGHGRFQLRDLGAVDELLGGEDLSHGLVDFVLDGFVLGLEIEKGDLHLVFSFSFLVSHDELWILVRRRFLCLLFFQPGEGPLRRDPGKQACSDKLFPRQRKDWI